MATLIAHSSGEARNNASTSSIDTSGASLLVIGVSADFGPISVADSKGNTWIALGSSAVGPSGATIWYTSTPTVGSGHTFSQSGGDFPSMAVGAFAGPPPGASGSSTGAAAAGVGSIQTPSLSRAAVDPSLFVAFMGWDRGGDTPSIDSGYSIFEDVNYSGGGWLGCAMAWLVTTGASSPTWSGGGRDRNALTAVFPSQFGTTFSVADPTMQRIPGIY